jgi:predicted transcriptional regulator
MSAPESSDVRSDAHRLIDSLPEGATWDEVMYRIYVCQCIESGLQDAEAGRVVDVEEVRQRFGLTEATAMRGGDREGR